MGDNTLPRILSICASDKSAVRIYRLGAEWEEQLLQPAATAPVAPINLPTGRQQVCPAAQRIEEMAL
ncbi:hypothetical protein FXO37_34700 [Capsicum annuum]|nr:hypothetical protein FXO37_34700 [Capsicum annuum]